MIHQNFPVFLESDVITRDEDLAFLHRNIIESNQDDDHDTDDETLKNGVQQSKLDFQMVAQ